jgi:Ca-activated chloride channel family protein
MNHFSFEFPYVFLLLPLIWLCQKKCPAKGDAIYFPYVELFFSSKALKNLWGSIFKWLSIIFIITALASPVVVSTFHAKADARDIMFVLDSSNSMLKKGFDDKNILKSKFQSIIEVLEAFIKKRESDRIGLITFATTASIASPLTFDREYLLNIVKKQKTGLVGEKTAIYDTLIRAIYLLENSKAKSKTIILLTDGNDNISVTTFDEIVSFLKKSHIKLYVIGVGDKRELDIKKLKELAKAGGGEFFFAGSKQSLSKIYEAINKSETSSMKAKTYKVYTYYYYFPLMFSMIFLMFFIYFKSVRGVAK